MRINGKEITHNEHLTFSQLLDLEKKYETLEAQIEKKFGVTAYYERSHASEAAYFTITHEDETFEISIRNHQNKYSNAENLVWISDYTNWNELKKYVFGLVQSFLNGTHESDAQRISAMGF